MLIKDKLKTDKIIIVLVMAFIGLAMSAIIWANSNSQPASVESEEAALSGAVDLRSSELASGGKHIVFGAAATVRVADYGATVNDGIDDTLAIRAALKDIKSTGGVLEFDPGAYNISGQEPNPRLSSGGDGYYKTMFSVGGYHNLHIKGNNTHFEGVKWAEVFHVANSAQITISGFSVDWANDIPVTGGVVVNESPQHVDIRIDENHQVRSSTSVDDLVEWDPIENRPADNGYRVHQVNRRVGCDVLGQRRVRCDKTAENINTPIEIGDTVKITLKKNGFNFVTVERTDGFLLEDIQLYSTPGLGVFAGGRARDVTVRNVTTEPLPGSNRWFSVSAGATNFIGGQRGNVAFNNVRFTHMGDDGTNVGSHMLRITEILNNSEVRMVFDDDVKSRFSSDRYMPFEGDILDVGEVASGLVDTKTIRVTSSSREGDSYRIGVQGSTANYNVGELVRNRSNTPNNTRLTNYFAAYNRGRGALIHAHNVLITNSEFNESSGPGLLVDSSTNAFSEGITPRDIYIVNNSFSHTNYGINSTSAAVTVEARRNGALSRPTISGIYICDNTFTNSATNPVFLGAVDGAIVSNNQFDSGVIEQQRSTNVSLAGNCPSFSRRNYQASRVGAGEMILPTSMADVGLQGSASVGCALARSDDGMFQIVSSQNNQRQYLAFGNGVSQTGGSYEVCVSVNYGNGKIVEKEFVIDA